MQKIMIHFKVFIFSLFFASQAIILPCFNAKRDIMLVWNKKKKKNRLKAGSIDGTDTIPHDHAIARAQVSVCE